MTDLSSAPKDDFLYPQSHYRGKFSPKNLAFNANLQEFSQRTNLICALESNGKLQPDEAYQRIEQLWEQLKVSWYGLKLDSDTPKEE